MRRMLMSAIAACFLAAGASQAAEIQAMGGSFNERVESIAIEGGRLMVRTPRRAIPLDSVKTIRFKKASPTRGATKLLLVGGDWLRGAIEGGNEDAIGLRSGSMGARQLPLELLRAIVPGADPERERALESQLKAADEVDWVRLKNGGTVKGSILQIDGTRVSIDTDSEGGSRMGEMSFAFSKVELVSIAPLDDPAPKGEDLRVVLRLTDGSQLTGVLVGFRQNAFTFRHPLGGKKPLTIQASKVADLSVQGGLFVYLSDLEPVQVKQHFPPEYTYEVDIWGFKKDTNVTGGKLRLDGRIYDKGLGVHSYCALSYKLGGKYKEFKAIVGLDDSTRYLGEPGFGAVVFQVLVDGQPAKEYPSGIVKRKGEKASEVLVKVSGKKTLTLVAAFDPTSLHVLGRANWADAHLIRKR